MVFSFSHVLLSALTLLALPAESLAHIMSFLVPASLSEIKQDSANSYGDEAIEHKVLQHVLKLVEEKISEVQNQAVKW